ncbi:MAG: flagellar basal body rod protein FlgB [Thermodesulfobacteriota bacterium]|nr:flagellar basal body rod protein FlgB [Thermodesulfobacteriota bacterium]
MGGIFGRSIEQFKSFMDYRVFRQEIIASNVANTDTPGYKARDVSFEKQLDGQMKMQQTHSDHLPVSQTGPAFDTFEEPYTHIGNDSNTVDMDREMMKLAQNQLLYDVAAQSVRGKLQRLKTVITEMR